MSMTEDRMGIEERVRMIVRGCYCGANSVKSEVTANALDGLDKEEVMELYEKVIEGIQSGCGMGYWEGGPVLQAEGAEMARKYKEGEEKSKWGMKHNEENGMVAHGVTEEEVGEMIEALQRTIEKEKEDGKHEPKTLMGNLWDETEKMGGKQKEKLRAMLVGYMVHDFAMWLNKKRNNEKMGGLGELLRRIMGGEGEEGEEGMGVKVVEIE